MKFSIKNKESFKKVINIILDILVCFFSIILLISLYSGIQTKIMKKPYTDFFGYSIFEVQTGSMAPNIKAGDWIIVKLTNDIRLNDIVTYEANGEYITHRVVELYEDTYVTRGDANNVKDGIISKSQTVGRVIKILGGIGIFKRIIFNPAVLIALIITVLICSLSFKKGKYFNKIKKTKVYQLIFKAYKSILKKINDDYVKPNKENNDKLDSIFDDYHTEKENETVQELDNLISNNNDNNIEVLDEQPSMAEKISGSTNDLDKYAINDLMISDENIEKELDKTSIFREILVDKSEINDTLLEIANNQVDNSVDLPKKELPVKEIPKEEDDQESNDIQLDYLNGNKGIHKSKSIIEKVMLIKEEEICEIITTLSFGDRLVNEATIQNSLIAAYLKAKYYNDYANIFSDYNVKNKITRFIEEYGNELKKEYEGSDSDYSSKVDKYVALLKLISNVDEARESIEENRVKIEFYKEKISSYAECFSHDLANIDELATSIIKIQRNYAGIYNYLLKKFESSVFELKISKIKGKKELFAVNLYHNISFSKVYSDFIVEKTYNEGVIAEDKLNVLLNLLSVRLVENMMSEDFDKRYIIYISKSLYDKKRKFESLLKLIEDKYAMEHLIMLVTIDDFIEHEKYIKKLCKIGYKFAIVLNKENMVNTYYKKIYLGEYIFADKSNTDVVERLESLGSDLSSKIIYDDIVDKIGDFEVNE